MKKYGLLLLVILLNYTCLAQTKALAKVEYKRDFGYINKLGEMVIPATFKEAGDFSDGLAAVEMKGDFGYIYPSGEWAIEPTFDDAKNFDSGVALVKIDGDWKYIDKTGRVLNIARGDKKYDFHQGVAFVRQGDLVGLMNTKGELLVEPLYLKITAFVDGYARILSKDDKWGIIDLQGNVVVQPKYEDIGDFVNGVSWTQIGDQLGLVTSSSYHEIDAVKIWNFLPGVPLTYARKNDLIGYVNKKGEWIIPPTFKEGKAFTLGLAPVYNGEKWGYIDAKGEMIISPQYENAESFSKDGLAPVRIDGQWGFIDTKGNLVIEAKYEIRKGGGGLNGFMSQMARKIIGKEQPKGFVNGVSRVLYRRDMGFINLKGEVLGEWYKYVSHFVEINTQK